MGDGDEGSHRWLRRGHAGAEGSHTRLLTGTKGAAKDGRDGDKRGEGARD